MDPMGGTDTANFDRSIRSHRPSLGVPPSEDDDLFPHLGGRVHLPRPGDGTAHGWVGPSRCLRVENPGVVQGRFPSRASEDDLRTGGSRSTISKFRAGGVWGGFSGCRGSRWEWTGLTMHLSFRGTLVWECLGGGLPPLTSTRLRVAVARSTLKTSLKRAPE